MLASLKNYRVRRVAPVTRLAEPNAKRAPLWPTFSIVFLLCAAVILTPLLMTIMNAMLVSLAAAIVLLGNKSVERPVLHVVLPFSFIAFLGLATGVGAARYDYFKDLWYVLNPVLVILTGYILYAAKPDLARGLRAFVIGGLIVGIWQLRGYFIDPSIILLPAAVIRTYVGTGLYAPVLALTILMICAGNWKDDLKLPVALCWLIFVILALSVVGVFSRTAVLVVAIALAARLGCFAKREWLRVLLPLVGFILIVFVLERVVDTESDEALLSFGAKLIRSVSEMAVSDYTAARDVAINFRGYETQQALNQFARGDIVEILFGQGFGTFVDLGFNLPLGLSETGGRYTRLIAIFHNGYIFLLTKSGLLGLMLFIYALLYMYFAGRTWSALPIQDQRSRSGRLLQAVALSLAGTTYIIAGVFNKFDMFPYLLMTGFVLAHVHRLNTHSVDEERAQPVAGSFSTASPAATFQRAPL